MCAKVTVFDPINAINQYTIGNPGGNLVVKVLDYGAIVTNVLFRDKTGRQLDLVLGFDTIDGYKRADNPHFGSLVGRVANRIAGGRFALNDTTYQLALNDAPRHNTLHGGLVGFDKDMWSLSHSTGNSVTLELVSKDGDQNFPGTVKVTTTYTVTATNELKLEYTGQLDSSPASKSTIINLTNHSYFNLNGCTDPQAVLALNHTVRMNADQYLEFNAEQIPDDRVLRVSDVPVMDFTGPKFITLSDRVPKLIDGYDHCYLITGATPTACQGFGIGGGDQLREAAVVHSPLTGVTMRLSTTEPSFQFYTANGLSGAFTTKHTQSPAPLPLAKYSAVCLEAQRYVDAVNHPKWRSQVVLAPGETYRQTTVYKFSNE